MAGEIVSISETAIRTQAEVLTEHFYRWENKGRGWQLWDYPVELEPFFQPFVFHSSPPPETFDDARKVSIMTSVFDRLRALFGESSRANPATACLPAIDWEEQAPAPFSDDSESGELQIAIPAQGVISQQASEQFVLSLVTAYYPINFEIIGTSDSIVFQLACRESDIPLVGKQLPAYFPEAVITEEKDFLVNLWDQSQHLEKVLVDFGLSQEFMRPLDTFSRFDLDPLTGIVGALSDLEAGELGLLQVLFQAVRYPWSDSIVRAVTDWNGQTFFEDSPEMPHLAKEKVSRPLFACVIRVAAQSPNYGRAWQIARSVGGALTQFSNPPSNELIALSNDGYPDEDHETDLLYRQTHRSGMLLNSHELVSLAHLPSASIRIEKLKRDEKRTKAAPTIASGHSLILGENTHRGKIQVVSLSPNQRIKHTYVIGASGTGKSTLLLNLIVQDIKSGEGIGVLDPHGDLIDQILGFIPEERANDVILLDPSDEEYPVGFNILSAHSELEKNLLSSDLVDVFRRLSTSWGDQMTSVLGNAVLAFLESGNGGTIADLRRFLVEAEYRKKFLQTVRDPEVVYFWQKEFPLLSGRPQGPLLTRLDTFLRPKLIRNMVSQKENRLDFRKIMDEKKIFLAKLSQGAIGEENAYLLGSLIVSKLHQMAMARQEVSEAERPNFYLYIDEFQNFITPSMASILSGARKYHLGLILAHQELRQLWNRNTDIANSVISNPYTRICFRLGDFDAQKLKDGFSFFDAKDLQNLGIGEAICRIERAEYDFNLKTLPLPKTELETARRRRQDIVELSHSKFGRRRKELEAEFLREKPEVSLPPVSERLRIEKNEELKIEPPVVESSPQKFPMRSIPVPHEPPLLGRGGAQHKYLQQLIKKLSEARGYRAIIEKQILDGLGSIDVSLERDDWKIACEICITTSCEHEFSNVQKCLAASYDSVLFVSPNRKTINKVKEFVSEKLELEQLSKVLFLLPEEFVTYLDNVKAEEAGKEETVRGYKVKVQYKALGEEENKTRKQAISQVIAEAVRRLKGSK